jgi:CRISPR/Cas system-associated exonuclease Cas4 (RecB family)
MLSKSKYLSGRQCLKKLYLEKHRPDLKPAVSPELQARFDQGNHIGTLAQKLYPGGKDASPESYQDFGKSIANTKNWIFSAWPTVYEATFSEDGVLAMLDIFHQGNGYREAIEVKSSTSVKDYHILDAAIQYYVMNQAGYRPDRFYILHLNNQYYRQGELRLEQLFTRQDVILDVLALQQDIPQQLEEMKHTLKANNEPQVKVGPHCYQPFACDFRDYCWPTLPQPSVFSLARQGKKAWRFFEEGKWAIADLDENAFRGRAKAQIEGVKYQREILQSEKIKAWLNTLDYPLYFFDFETIGLAVPRYNGTKPYGQTPVQYSLHVVEKAGAAPRHYEFLPTFESDPREDLIKQLIAELGEHGSIIAYNISFEQRCLKELARCFPEYEEPLLELCTRFVDLIVPFQKNWLYKPAMGESNSIKAVYPALFPLAEEGYEGLVINNGSEASNYLSALAQGTYRGSEHEKAQLQKDLRAYCQLDTWAMVKIWRYLLAVRP